MQSRPAESSAASTSTSNISLLEALIKVENILPDVREGIAALEIEMQEALRTGNFNKIKDRESSNLYSLVADLENIYKATSKESLGKNVIARIKTALYDGHLIITQTSQLMSKCMKAVSQMLDGLFTSGSENSFFPSQKTAVAATQAAVEPQRRNPLLSGHFKR